MYSSISTAQHVLNRLCVTVNQLQGSLKDVQDELHRRSSTSGVVASSPSPDNNNTSNLERSMLTKRVDNLTQDVEHMKKELASGIQQAMASSSKPAALPPSGGELDTVVRRECEASVKKQRDLLEALLTAKYDKLVARCVQDGIDNLRKELLCRMDTMSHDLSGAIDARLQQVQQAVGKGPAAQQLQSMQQQIQQVQQQMATLQQQLNAVAHTKTTGNSTTDLQQVDGMQDADTEAMAGRERDGGWEGALDADAAGDYDADATSFAPYCTMNDVGASMGDTDKLTDKLTDKQMTSTQPLDGIAPINMLDMATGKRGRGCGRGRRPK
jgi:hypothetical protein